MNRIIEVNETLAYVVVEPGVTFFDLDSYFKKNHIDLWISAPALGWGSVVGNVSHAINPVFPEFPAMFDTPSTSTIWSHK